MSVVDEQVDRAAGRMRQLADRLAAEGGLKAKLAQPLAEDAEFLPKLKPSLIVARARGRAPTNGRPAKPLVSRDGPQVGPVPEPPKKRTGGPNPIIVVGLAFVAGVALAKWLDWRGHAHPRD